ncbi:MAG: sodium-translocating pyrophosphatase [Chloroflexi bacterium]|nr:sodium-translocating pyrophosphatase [Chloroflexota bacterium]
MHITLFEGFTADTVTGFEKGAMIAVLVVAVLGLLYAWMLTRQIMSKSVGNEKMQKIAKAIRDGGNAYLKRQFKTILLLIVVLAAFIFVTGYFGYRPPKPEGEVPNPDWLIGLGRALGFLLGAGFSATVGYVGMNMAMQGNIRVAEASRHSFVDALKIAYRTGTITGMLTDGLGLLGGTLIFIIFFKDAPLVLLGFGFGGTLIALFMRVGGGIYTKAADVGADLVGKVEKDIPEDDPRNAAVIADLVGDNVGDCAGMAADIFESYEVTIVSALILGLFLTEATGGQLMWILFPLLVRAAGVFSSIISTYTVGSSKSETDAMKAIHRGYNLAALMSIASFGIFGWFYCHDLRFFWATSVGVVLAVAINQITDYYTGATRGPVKEIAKSTKTGPATTILSGLGIGLESSVGAILIIAGSIAASALIWQNGLPAVHSDLFSADEIKLLCIFYGVALCGIGQLTLTGNNISMDAFGPVADNANGIAEMAGLEPKARKTLADLDAVGNTTKAITKGIAIASAVLAAVALFASFKFEYNVPVVDLIQWKVFVAFLIGGAIPFLFSSLLINAVGRAAYCVVNEVRWQFANIKGIWEGTTDPDYSKVVTIVTGAAQKELLTPALLAIISPIVIGFVFGLEALAGFLAGVIVVGQLMAVFQSNAGGAWDNAKKVIEDEPRDLAKNTGKGSDRHKASVVGDTIGDPLKDTSGPALNPLIKVINLVSVIAATMMLTKAGLPRDNWALSVTVGVIGILIIVAALYYSKTQKTLGRDDAGEGAEAKANSPAAAAAPPEAKHPAPKESKEPKEQRKQKK